MTEAKHFKFNDYTLDKLRSTLTFKYEVEFNSGAKQEFIHSLSFYGAHAEMWERIPKDTLDPMCQSLNLICGVLYWKIFCAPNIVLQNFELSKAQADFWNAVYERGLGEFFYLMKKDFRGLIQFPYSEKNQDTKSLPLFPRQKRVLLAQGGGKDSIVSAEILRAHNVPFDVFVSGYTSMQDRAILSIGRPLIRVVHHYEKHLGELLKQRKVAKGWPSTTIQMFISLLAAALHDYQFVIFSNEHSADLPNTTYLGHKINHQWSKSREAEKLVRDYIAAHITKDVIIFSLLHQYTEIEMIRKFVQYPKYFYSFSSRNINFRITEAQATSRPGFSFWCNSCSKCLFIFACLTAFLPKTTVIEIFGENLYAKFNLWPLAQKLLGISGIKPLDCVGSAEEMIVAMHRASLTGDYSGDPVMQAFLRHFTDIQAIAAMDAQVFSLHGESTVPTEFVQLYADNLGPNQQPVVAKLTLKF